jgi:hypothetical protein
MQTLLLERLKEQRLLGFGCLKRLENKGNLREERDPELKEIERIILKF